MPPHHLCINIREISLQTVSGADSGSALSGTVCRQEGRALARYCFEVGAAGLIGYAVYKGVFMRRECSLHHRLNRVH